MLAGVRRRADLDRCYKPVATADDCSDVDWLLLRVAKRAPEIGHVDLEVALMDEQLRPGCGHQFVPADQFPTALNQGRQDGQCTGPEAGRHALRHTEQWWML